MQSAKKRVLSVLLTLMLSLTAFVALPATVYADAPVLTNPDEYISYDKIEVYWEVDGPCAYYTAIYLGNPGDLSATEVEAHDGAEDFYEDTAYLNISTYYVAAEFYWLDPATEYTIYLVAENIDGYSDVVALTISTDTPPPPTISLQSGYPHVSATYMLTFWDFEDEYYTDPPLVYIALYAGPAIPMDPADVVDAIDSIDSYSALAEDWGYFWIGYEYYPLAPAAEYTVYAFAENDSGASAVLATTFLTDGNQPPVDGTDICAVYMEDDEDYGFESLEQAMSVLQSGIGEYIYLLDDITSTEGLYSWTNATIDTMGFDLEVGYIEVEGGNLTIFSSLGDLDLTVTNNEYCIYVYDGGYLEIVADSVTAKGGINVSYESELYITADSLDMMYLSVGDSEAVICADEITASDTWAAVDAYNGAIVTIQGNITVDSEYSAGLFADSGASITMDGNIKAGYGAVAWEEDTEITITGNIDADNNGIEAHEDAVVTLTGNINAGNLGVLADDYADVTVIGDIEARIGVQGGDNSGDSIAEGATITVIGNINAEDIGVNATLESVISITGDITVANTGPFDAAGVVAIEGSVVTVTGNIKAEFGVVAGRPDFDGATIFITGNIIAETVGILAQNSSVVEIVGNITVTDLEDGVGVSAYTGSKVTVDGLITARFYIGFDNGEGYYDYRNIGDNDPTSLKAGYRQYTDTLDDTSYVWVRTPTIPPTTPPTGDSLALGLLLSLFLSTLGAFGFLTRRRALIIKS